MSTSSDNNMELVGWLSTVVLVHGTFSAPKPDRVQWYQPGSAFCRLLDRRLADAGVSCRCWVQYGEPRPHFHWGAKNEWISRADGAAALRRYLDGLQQPCHIVAHSHGGNVVLEALGWNMPSRAEQIDFRGTVTLLGTPIIETTPAERGYWRLFYPILGCAILVGVVRSQAPFVDALFVTMAASAAIALWMWLPVVTIGEGGREQWLRVQMEKEASLEHGRDSRLLVINSAHDEALGFLQSLLRMSNPFVRRNNPGPLGKRIRAFLGSEWRRVFGGVKPRIDRSAMIALAAAGAFVGAVIYFALSSGRTASWLVVATMILVGLVTGLRSLPMNGFQLPRREFRHPVGVHRIIGATITVLARSLRHLAAMPILTLLRRFSWPFLQSYGLDIGGGNLDVSSVRVVMKPSNMEGFVFKELPASFVDAVTARRRDSTHERVNGLLDTLRDHPLSVDGMKECYRALEAPDIVHTSYCSHLGDEAVIAEIVAHIGRYEERAHGAILRDPAPPAGEY